MRVEHGRPSGKPKALFLVMPDIRHRASTLYETEPSPSTHGTHPYYQVGGLPPVVILRPCRRICTQVADARAQPDPSVDVALTFAEWVRMTVIEDPAILVMPDMSDRHLSWFHFGWHPATNLRG